VVTLASDGAITQPGGIITAARVDAYGKTGPYAASITLGQANVVPVWSALATGQVTLNALPALTLAASPVLPGYAVRGAGVSVTSVNGGITNTAPVEATAGMLGLTAAGPISVQQAVTARDGITLQGVGVSTAGAGTLANSGSGGITVNAGGGAIGLGTAVTAAGQTVTLRANGAIAQTAGIITAQRLDAYGASNAAAGAIMLTGANLVTQWSALGTGAVSLTASVPTMTLLGSPQDATAAVRGGSITLANGAGALTASAPLVATAGTLTATASTTMRIEAPASATGTISFTATGFTTTASGSLTSTAGGIDILSLTNPQALPLTLEGPVQAFGDVSLRGYRVATGTAASITSTAGRITASAGLGGMALNGAVSGQTGVDLLGGAGLTTGAGASITSNAGAITATSSGAMTLGAALSGRDGIGLTGTGITTAAAATLASSNGAVSANAGGGALGLGAAVTAATGIGLTGTGITTTAAATLASGGGVSAEAGTAALSLGGAVSGVGSVTLGGTGITTATAATLASSAGTVSANAGSGALSLGGAVSALTGITLTGTGVTTLAGATLANTGTGGIGVNAGTGAILLGDRVTASGQLVTFTAGTTIGQSAAAVITGNLAATAGGAIALDTAPNAIGTLTATAGGGIALQSVTPVTVQPAGLTAGAGTTIALTVAGLTSNGPIGFAGASSSNLVTLATDALVLNAGLSPGATGLVRITPRTAGNGIELGGTTLANTLQIGSATLANILGPRAILTTTQGGAITGTAPVTASVGVLELASAAGISQAATAPITAASLAATAAGDIALIAPNAIGAIGASLTIPGFGLSAGGNLAFRSAAPLLGIGNAVQAGAGATLRLAADDMAITAPVTAQGGTIRLETNSSGRPILLGADGAGALSLTAAELGLVNAGGGRLVIGSLAADGNGITAGAITQAGAIDLTGRAATLELRSGGLIEQTGPAAALTVGTLLATVDTAQRASAADTSPAYIRLVADNQVGSYGGITLALDGRNFTAPSAAGVFNDGVTLRAAPGATLQIGGGGITVANAATQGGSTIGGRITLIADDVALAAPVFAASAGTIGTGTGYGVVEILPRSLGRGVTLGGTQATTLSLDPAELQQISTGGTGLLQIGRSDDAAAPGSGGQTAGNILIAGGVPLRGRVLELALYAGAVGGAAGTITDSDAGAISVARLAGAAPGGIILDGTGHGIDTLDSLVSSNGPIVLTTSGSLGIAGTIVTQGAAANGGVALTAGGDLVVTTAGSVSANGGNLSLTAGAGILNAGRLSAQAAGGAGGAVTLTANGGDLSNAGNVTGGQGGGNVTASGTITGSASGSILLSSTSQSMTQPEAGVLRGGGIALTANGGNIQQSGGLLDAGAGTLSLSAPNGSIQQTSGPAGFGALNGGVLTAAAGGAIDLLAYNGGDGLRWGGNTLASLGNMSANTALRVQTVAVPTTITGALAANGPVQIWSERALSASNASITSRGTAAAALLGSNDINALSIGETAGLVSLYSGATIGISNVALNAEVALFRAGVPMLTSGAFGNGGATMTLSGLGATIGSAIQFAAPGGIGAGATSTVAPRGGLLPAVVFNTQAPSVPAGTPRLALLDGTLALVTPDTPGRVYTAQTTQVRAGGLGNTPGTFGPPSAAPAGNVQLALNAGSSPVFALVNSGSVTGTINAGRFGLQGVGGSASLTGSLNGGGTGNSAIYADVTRPIDASQLNAYRINDCIFASTSCGGSIPPAPQVQAQASLLNPPRFSNTPVFGFQRRQLDATDVVIPNVGETIEE